MRVLVTGATGFVCGSVVRALAARGHETIAAVRTEAVPSGAAAAIVWDFERERPRALPTDIDAIVHGAQSRAYRSLPADGGTMFTVNLAGTWSVLDYAARIGVRRFCLLSSGTVYEPYRGSLDETTALAPTSFLGATKLAAEVLARPYAAAFSLSVLRLFAPYGPGQRDRLIPDIIERVRTGKAVELAADGAGLWLAPTYVDDIAEIVATSIEDEWTGTINVAAPEFVSLRQLAESIGDLLGRRPVFAMTDREPIRFVPPLKCLADRFDLTRFRPLRDGLRSAIAAGEPPGDRTVRRQNSEIAEAAASRSEDDLATALRLRFGRSGAIREILRINDDIDAHGNIVRTGPWSPGLWLYYRYRQLRSMATLRAGARLLPVRPLRWQGSRARRFAPAAGRAAGRRKTATMLVADTAIDRRVLLTARSLQEAGWTVTVIALPFPNWPVARDEDRLAFPDVAIVRLNPRWPVRAPRRGPGLIDRSRFWQQVYPYYLHFLNLALRAPAEIYVAHDLPALPAAATAAEMLGVQLVYDAHELYPEQRVFDADRAALLARAERELIRRPALVTTVNASIAAEIGRRYSIALPEIILNAPAVPPGGLPVPRSNLIRDRLGLDPGARILLFQGGLSMYRNLDTLVAAMRCVATPDVVLVLMGPDGGVRGELQRIAAELGLLGRRVHFLDAVPQTVLLSWTASADIGVIPYPPVDLNSRLCSPNKLFEFIVAEIPILANDLPELRRFVGANGFGQNHPMGDPPALARAIDAMCAADLDRYRAALRRRSAEFVWDGQGRKLTGLYEAVHMAGHAAPVAALAEAS